MGDDDKLRAAGDAQKRLTEATEQLAKPKQEGAKIGLMFQHLGIALSSNPEGIVFDGESSPGFHTSYHVSHLEWLDSNTIRALVRDYQTELTKQREAEQNLKPYLPRT